MNLESLSDAELRTRILEFGCSVGPVTHTTRKILIKKLKNLEESRGNAGSRHSLAARYSSDDTDDDTLANTKKKKKAANTRRQTLANPMPPPASAPLTSNSKSPSRKRVSKNLNIDSEGTEYNSTRSNSNRSTPTKDKTFSKSNKSLNDNDGLETGSDSDAVEEMPQPVIVSKFGGGTTKIYNDRTSLGVNSPKSLETNWRRTIQNPLDANLRTSTTPKNDRYSVNLPKASTILDSIRNDSSTSKDNSKKDDVLSNHDSPYSSAFLRNLSTQKAKNSPPVSGYKHRFSGLSSTPEVKESDSNGHFNPPLRSKYPSGLSSTYVTSSLDKSRDINRYKSSAAPREEIKNNQNIISVILVTTLTLFFVAIAIIYLGLEGKTDTSPMLPTAGSNMPVCNPGSVDRNSPGVNCVLQKNLEDTMALINQLNSVLLKRAILHECDGAKEPSYIKNNELVDIFSSHDMPESVSKVKENLQMAHLLLFKNPDWKISLVSIEDDNEPQVLDSMNNIFLTRVAGKLGFVKKDPDLPRTCSWKKFVLNTFSILLIAACAGLALLLSQKLVYMYWSMKQNAEQEVYKLVSQIINMLEVHHQNYATTSPGGTQESYLAINHIRDNLIAPKDRKKLSSFWEKAVKFLDENESRIRREVQLVSGEEFQVWRWLPSNSNTSGSPGSSPAPKMSKVWQGSAFETMDGSANSLTCSPTPCLKIRHMFDPDVEFEDDWETKVKDAILEKCGEKVKILHIKVDRGSREGCVYMKCMSQEDAGKAYKALHGCWFDGHLVTVKYLRLERYHERFPEAKNFVTPLKPSNNQRLSMQAHYWTNASEEK